LLWRLVFASLSVRVAVLLALVLCQRYTLN
jgi:hypothetical protein